MRWRAWREMAAAQIFVFLASHEREPSRPEPVFFVFWEDNYKEMGH
jgi:hypothetical protein